MQKIVMSESIFFIFFFLQCLVCQELIKEIVIGTDVM